MKPSEYAKAIVGGVAAAYAVFGQASGPHTPGGAGITSGEWVGIAVSGLLAAVAVWGVPNTIPSVTETPRSIPVATGRHAAPDDTGGSP